MRLPLRRDNRPVGIAVTTVLQGLVDEGTHPYLRMGSLLRWVTGVFVGENPTVPLSPGRRDPVHSAERCTPVRGVQP